MNKIHSLYSCDVEGCTDYPMLVVTANMRNDSTAFRKYYTDQLGGTSVMVPMETGGTDIATMLNAKYSGPSFWIEPDRHFTNIIAGGGYHDIMTDSLIELHDLQPHVHDETNIGIVQQPTRVQSSNILLTGSTLTIDGFSGEGTIQLFALNGALLYSNNISGKTAIELADFSAGTYCVRFRSSAGISSKMIVLE